MQKDQLSREALERLSRYEAVLRDWQPRINLVANSTMGELWQRHFLDSAQLLPLVPSDARTFADLGSGGGFPGLVLAILLASPAPVRPGAADHGRPWPAAVTGGQPVGSGIRFTLVESDRRKGAFLREVARQCGVAVEILSTRIENPETHVMLGQVDVVTARALAPMERLLGLAAPLFGSGTVGLFLKGQGARSEVEAARASWAFDAEFVPSLTASDASIVVVRRLSPR